MRHYTHGHLRPEPPEPSQIALDLALLDFRLPRSAAELRDRLAAQLVAVGLEFELDLLLAARAFEFGVPRAGDLGSARERGEQTASSKKEWKGTWVHEREGINPPATGKFSR